jgi:hypothetical protein
MGSPTLLLPVEMTAAGVAEARLELDQLETLVTAAAGGPAPASVAPSVGPGTQPDIVTVYEHARTVPNSHTPRLLELFAREDPLTPEEIGIALGNGTPFNKRQGRAFVRNLSRMEGHLLATGKISGRVLSKHFSQYEQEGAGRYGLSDEDRAALRAHLGI